MDIKIQPSKLCGTVNIPSSKSMTHRILISAALAEGTSVISNVSFSKDIYATIDSLKALGAEITVNGNTVTVIGVKSLSETAVIDCCESGSTLRFMIPIACALGITSTFEGQGRLPERPITPYIRELSKKGIKFDKVGTMPFTVEGKLSFGTFELEGDISSQFIIRTAVRPSVAGRRLGNSYAVKAGIQALCRHDCKMPPGVRYYRKRNCKRLLYKRQSKVSG